MAANSRTKGQITSLQVFEKPPFKDPLAFSAALLAGRVPAGRCPCDEPAPLITQVSRAEPMSPWEGTQARGQESGDQGRARKAHWTESRVDAVCPLCPGSSQGQSSALRLWNPAFGGRTESRGPGPDKPRGTHFGETLLSLTALPLACIS